MLYRWLVLIASCVAALSLFVSGATGGADATTADFPVTITAGNGKVTIRQATQTRRLALADRHGVAVRDRRRQAGDRRRRPVRLPEDRAEDVPVGVHAQRRGDRSLRAGSRRRLVRPEGARRRARTARHPGHPPRRGAVVPGCVPADPPARAGHRAAPGRDEGHRPDEDADRTGGADVEGQGGRSHRLPRADAGLLLCVVPLVRRARSTRFSVSRTSPTRPIRAAPAIHSCRPSTSSRRARI